MPDRMLVPVHATVDPLHGLLCVVRGFWRAKHACTCAQVPYTQPERASFLFRQWITNAATAPNPSAAADILQ